MRLISWAVVLGALALGATGAAAKPALVDAGTRLDAVLSEAEAVAKVGTTQPVVVFDLDATLFDNRPRNIAIFRAWATQPDRLGTPEATKILAMKAEQTEYLVKDSLAKVGITDAAIVESVTAFWLERFFTEWTVHDTPTPGGPGYVQALHKAGAFIVYLTGRDAPRMLTGTTQSLMISGYPIGLPRTQLIMKPHAKFDDEVFKDSVMSSLRRTGKVIALFDNEPGNVNLMKKAFPEAKVIFLKTMHRPDAPKVDAGIPSVPDFRR